MKPNIILLSPKSFVNWLCRTLLPFNSTQCITLGSKWYLWKTHGLKAQINSAQWQAKRRLGFGEVNMVFCGLKAQVKIFNNPTL